MQFSINREKLSKVLLIISHQVLTKPALPVLANILLEAEKNLLKISATNLELGVILNLEAKVAKIGKVTLPARTLTELVSSLTQPEVSFKLENSQMEVATQTTSAKIPVIPADEYPAIPKISQALVEIDGKRLIESLERVIFAASQDSGRPILTGVLVEFQSDSIQFIATDGYRLSFEKISTGKSLPERPVIIPAKTLAQLTRLISEEAGPTKILLDATINQIGFEVGKTALVSRLIDGNFPDWQKIIPESFKTKAVVSTPELSQAIKAASVFARESGNTVRLSFSQKKLEIKTQSGLGTSVTTIPATISGEGLEAAFNWRYLAEALQVISDDKVEISLVESLLPARFAPVKSTTNFFHIVMPVRVT